jgi:anhydro-N-acetylmuramic acid kinase
MSVVLGLMSGTSLDGLDLCCVRFADNHNDFQILAAKTIPYSAEWKSKLENAFFRTTTAVDALDKEYGVFLAEHITDFIKTYSLPPIDLIASHGHTVFHKPNRGITKQIGSGEEIAKHTGIQVVYDFRTQDVALGGQGAPLVPIGDSILFSDYDACLNLGGFANVSFDTQNSRIAYDIGACNLILNHFAQKLGYEYDDQGLLAQGGTCDESLLKKLNDIDYYEFNPPKSLAREFAESQLLPFLSNYDEKKVLHTYTKHIGFQIGVSLKKSKATKCLITGGGTHNRFLMDQIQKHTNCFLEIPDDTIVDYKEALIFALLGLLRIENQINVLSSVTGAKHDHSSGRIAKPKSLPEKL